MPEKPPAKESAPIRRLSYIATLQHRLEDEAERRMAGLSSLDMKGVIAWLEAKQLQLAVLKAVEDNHYEVLKGTGKQEVLLELIEDAHAKLAKVARDAEGAGGEEDGSTE